MKEVKVQLNTQHASGIYLFKAHNHCNIQSTIPFLYNLFCIVKNKEN